MFARGWCPGAAVVRIAKEPTNIIANPPRPVLGFRLEGGRRGGDRAEAAVPDGAGARGTSGPTGDISGIEWDTLRADAEAPSPLRQRFTPARFDRPSHEPARPRPRVIVPSPDAEIESDVRRPGPRGWVKVAIKSVLAVVVIAAVARHASKTVAQLRDRGESIRIAPAGFAAAVGLYVAGLVPLGVFYGRVLAASRTPIGTFAAIRAYLISHLGKYVPGKALVVVMRAGLSVPSGARPATAAFATFYETLVMMAAGGLLAAVALGRGESVTIPLPFGDGRSLTLPLAWLGLGTGLAFLVVVEPKVFPRLATLARLPFRGVGPDALPTVSWRLLAEGLALATVGWTLLGLSQVAVLAAIGPSGRLASEWPTVVGSVALATVAGFVVPISPGGLGVREWVLWTALASAIDRDRAVVAALVLRLAWVVGELAAAAVLVAVRRPGLAPGAAAP